MAKNHSTRVQCVCPECGATFSEWPSQLKTIGGTCCSKRCGYARRSKMHRRDIAERFWEKVTKTDSCWLWTGTVSGNGYGKIHPVKGRVMVWTHRLSWELAFGPIPEGMDVCHNCPGGDNPRCVNPAHLFLGTHADNMRDAGDKRQMPHGERHLAAKLTDADVLSIRVRYADGGITQQQLADEFGVSNSVICRVINRKAWAHV